MSSEILVGNDPELIARCFHLRTLVFVDEQNVSVADEMDGLDDRCTHFLLHREGRDLGTARLRIVAPYGKAERVCVIAEERGKGLARDLMLALEKEATQQGLSEIRLGSQLTALPFYQRLGYSAYGELFDDAGIDHRMMMKRL